MPGFTRFFHTMETIACKLRFFTFSLLLCGIAAACGSIECIYRMGCTFFYQNVPPNTEHHNDVRPICSTRSYTSNTGSHCSIMQEPAPLQEGYNYLEFFAQNSLQYTQRLSSFAFPFGSICSLPFSCKRNLLFF